ncbi:MAG: hypothetical protein U9Q92_04870, partial [archaeon]|nr:hypothetical protein [archaeon]
MKKTNKFKKAQTAEILNFLILVVVVTIVIIGLKTVVIDQKVTTSGTAQSSHEEGSFRSGVNAFMVMTEEASGKTFLELLGYVGFLENTTIDLGGKNNPLVVNVTEEVTKRLDAIYGEGHWNLILPIPYRTGVQIFVVVDTSNSMCDDILNLKTEVPDILKELKKADKDTTIDLYFIENRADCYWKNRTTGAMYSATITCADFAGIDDFYCHALSEKESECSYKHGGNDEDWGNGVACISEAGPGESGWNDFSIRIGMPLSDELTRSSDCGCTEGGCGDRRISLDNGIESAKKNNVMIFPLKADSCGIICFSNNPNDCVDLTTLSVGGGITYCQCGAGL